MILKVFAQFQHVEFYIATHRISFVLQSSSYFLIKEIFNGAK